MRRASSRSGSCSCSPAPSCRRAPSDHRRDGRRRRLRRGAARLAAAPSARPRRGLGDPYRARQRHRARIALPAPGDRVRPRGRRPARTDHQRRLGEHRRGAGRGPPPRAQDDRVRRLRRRPDRTTRRLRITSSSRARSTSHGSRRRRRAPTTCCASWSSSRSLPDVAAPSPEEILEQTREEGQRRLSRPLLETSTTALLGGFDIGFGIR